MSGSAIFNADGKYLLNSSVAERRCDESFVARSRRERGSGGASVAARLGYMRLSHNAFPGETDFQPSLYELWRTGKGGTTCV